MPCRCARYGVSARSQPATSAPHACASSAYALMPAPPTPAIQMRLPASGCEGDELIRDPLGGVGLGGGEHRRAHLLEARRRREQMLDERRHVRARIAVEHDDRTARALEVER